MHSTYKSYLLFPLLLAPFSYASPVNTPPSTPPNLNALNLNTGNAPAHAVSIPSHYTDGILKKWATAAAQQDKLRMMAYTKGGSEKWVQFEVEYAMKVDAGIPTEKEIKFREVAVYQKPNAFADWVFAPEEGKKGRIVELKVQSGSQVGAPLIALVKDDQDKVSSGLKPAYKDYETSVYAIAWDPATQDSLRSERGMVPLDALDLKLQSGKTIKFFVWDKPIGGESPKTPTKAAGPKHSRSEKHSMGVTM